MASRGNFSSSHGASGGKQSVPEGKGTSRPSPLHCSLERFGCQPTTLGESFVLPLTNATLPAETTPLMAKEQKQTDPKPSKLLYPILQDSMPEEVIFPQSYTQTSALTETTAPALASPSPGHLPALPQAGPGQAPWLADPPQMDPPLEFLPVSGYPAQATPSYALAVRRGTGASTTPISAHARRAHTGVPTLGIPPTEPVVPAPALLPPMYSAGRVPQVPIVSTLDRENLGPGDQKQACCGTTPGHSTRGRFHYLIRESDRTH